MNTMHFYGMTDTGRCRSNNEDTFLAEWIKENEVALCVVVDGVGGYDGGEVAAAMAKEYIAKKLKDNTSDEWREPLRLAVTAANNAIFQERHNSRFDSMACVLTSVVVELDKQRITMAHVGDTRLYQLTDNGLTKLSHDHSFVGELEECGELTEVQAMRHPNRNRINRAIGKQYLDTRDDEYIETETFPLTIPSSLLICSDGLSDMITSAEISKLLQANTPTEQKAQSLIDAANQAGGKDNITVVVMDLRNETA